ncbi:hypothetical protein [Nonomuraea guangzhouensis]|uniref:Uncharacterized protein n=1 Tax=Nonomuraea guangzhouensis TaxID=1291555 RepID=A0ABW4GBX6_9ACTN|nr:hypothetical protein [Nonomuraea guangzhouensis]
MDTPNLPARRPVEEHADRRRRLTRRLADRPRIQPYPPAGQIVGEGPARLLRTLVTHLGGMQ